MNDNNLIDFGETVSVPGGGDRAGPRSELVSFNQVSAAVFPQLECTWDPETGPARGRVNAAADVTQGFYFNSVFHNYLEEEAIRLHRAAAGNFEAVDGDAVRRRVDGRGEHRRPACPTATTSTTRT